MRATIQGLFLSIETKAADGDSPTPEQVKWANAVNRVGGIAVISNGDLATLNDDITRISDARLGAIKGRD